ncbi:hypothetical protein F5B22DRAFT_444862 [Xylaria bambusicola]|uniref:uncharacterized protein n=1 Tax=Xylaria bambusicola TaxID=326684 RepID=UPI0020085E15|nr:uncharacterized protein F5B22DRAFT_444862 [Xylaria bambusicola]KAI0506512.1 hypothetical protein F5B22DRAFT_444862 [Xylaria bambusicola]
MADGGDTVRQDTSPCPHPGSRKARPRTQAPELQADHSFGKSKKSHKRSPTAVNISNEKTVRGQSPSHISLPKEGPQKVAVENPATSTEKTEEDHNSSKSTVKDDFSLTKPNLCDPTPLSELSKIGPATESEDSSGSCETVTHTLAPRRDSSGKGTTARSRKPVINKPNALSFLDSDSPQLTPEGIQRTVKEALEASADTATSTSPSTHSTASTSSSVREDLFDVFGDHETEQSNSPRSTSPEHSVNGDTRSTGFEETGIRTKPSKIKRRSYGTPEMARAKVQHFHTLPDDITPRAPNQQFIKHLRPEKPPLTGYELVASKLSATSVHRSGLPLRPIYRRFETLNHRILLHLQDEICEFEEQLRHLDNADTQNRRLPNGIVPASRRAESISGSELHWHRTDILGKIAFKLEQYNRVLSSFRETLSLPAPTPADVLEYRGFLGSYAPIAEVETQFLNATDDLVWLGYSDEEVATNEEDVVTPISRSDITDFHPRRRVSILSQSDSSRRYDEGRTPSPSHITVQGAAREQDAANKQTLMHLSLALAAAITLPILTFLVIPGFIGRMTVVCLVGIGILGALVQGNVMRLRASQEICISVGLYGGVMAFLAGMIS